MVAPAWGAPGNGRVTYKWVDSQGNVHYSDKPIPGGIKIKLPKPTTYSAPNVAMPAQSRPTDGRPATQEGYSDFAISSPSSGQTFWNADSVTVSLTVSPGLKAGDTITISVDGQAQGPSNATSATFSGLERGEHTATATLTQVNGGPISAAAVTFYIQQKSGGMH